MTKEVAETDILYRKLPANILAEQMILGSLLVNNENLNKVADYLVGEHFFDPAHQRIFGAIIKFTERNVLANPITLKNHFDKDETLQFVGGGDYLARLASLASSVINIQDYAKTIVDYYLRRRLINVGEDIVNNAYQKEIEVSASEQVELAEQELFNLSNEGSQGNGGFQNLSNILVSAMDRIQNAYKHKDRIIGVSSGLIDLDAYLGGMQGSDLLIIAARPSMGKTSLAINIAMNAANFLVDRYQQDKKDDDEKCPSVGLFSLEMSSEQLASRMISMVSGLNSSLLRNGKIRQEDFADIVRANKELYKLPFFIDDTPSLTISALRTRARRLKRKNNLGLIVVDYLQLLRGSGRGGDENRVQEVSEITQGLKAIAKELNVPVIALSQLSRAVEQREDKRPLLSDLRESGSIEQDADVVMFIYREEYYLRRRQPAEGTPEHLKWQAQMDEIMNLCEVIIAKQRNGPVGTVKLYYDNNTTKFSNYVDVG